MLLLSKKTCIRRPGIAAMFIMMDQIGDDAGIRITGILAIGVVVLI